MTGAELAEQVWQQLENRAAYPIAEVYQAGLNAAMALLCLVRPALYTQQIVTTLNAGLCALDLLLIAPRAHRVLRVVHGTAPTDRPTTTTRTPRIDLVTREQLARRFPNWITRRGPPQYSWMLGRHLLAFTPRPTVDTLMTVTVGAIPPALLFSTPAQVCALDAIHHPLVGDLATGLLLLKQGAGEAERGLGMIQRLLQVTSLDTVIKQLHAAQRDATRVLAPAGR